MKTILILIAVLTGFISQLNAQEEVDTIWTRQFGDINDVAFTPDENKVIVSADAVVYVFDLQTGEELQRFPNNITNEVFVRVSDDGKYLYTSKPAKFDLETYETIIDEPELKEYFHGIILLDSQNKLLGTKAYDQTDESLVVLDTETFEVLDTLRSVDECYKIEKSYNEKYFVVESKYLISDELITELVLYNAETLEELKELQKGNYGVSDFKFKNNTYDFYFNYVGDLIKINIENENENDKYSMALIKNYVLASNDLIVASSYNYDLLLLDFQNKSIVNTIKIQNDFIWDLSKSEKYLALGTSRTLKILDYNKILNVDENDVLVNISTFYQMNNTFELHFNENVSINYYLYNSNGEVLREAPFVGTILNIDLSGISNGAYLLKISINEKNEIIKFIKE